MAFDGITVSSVICELNNTILNGRIDKIYQPEKDEIFLQIRAFGSVYRLLLSANPSAPRFNFTNIRPENPPQPPLFCMVLRKHIGGGKILNITQPNFERIVVFEIEGLNELGDYTTNKLILEIMGRHSNLILVNSQGTVLEAARHINFEVSSVREVLPGKPYQSPPSQNKINPLLLSEDNLTKAFFRMPSVKVQQLIYKSYTGISPVAASEICFRAGLDPSLNTELLGEGELQKLYLAFNNVMDEIRKGSFTPTVYYDGSKPVDFAPISLTCLAPASFRTFSSPSEMLEAFYSKRDSVYRMNQKTHDLRKLISNNIERCVKKQDIQQKTLNSIKNREKHRLYGELIVSYAYSIPKGAKFAELINFYDENQTTVTVPLDPALTPQENAQKYFKKYNKEKRTYTALQPLIKETRDELFYLESVLAATNTCQTEQDIKEIRRELYEQGFIKKHKGFEKNKKNLKKSQPIHYISSDGFDIYVGKNNIQNDELTMKTARANDLWFHTKQIPGSHVVVFTQGKDVPETTVLQAATLAAYYSKARQGSLVPVDYTQKRNIKKPNGAKPGFVIYTTNKTAYVTPTEEFIDGIKQI